MAANFTPAATNRQRANYSALPLCVATFWLPKSLAQSGLSPPGDTAVRGTPDTNRTCDLPLRRGLLYPLSYRGVGPDCNVSGASSLRSWSVSNGLVRKWSQPTMRESLSCGGRV